MIPALALYAEHLTAGGLLSTVQLVSLARGGGLLLDPTFAFILLIVPTSTGNEMLAPPFPMACHILGHVCGDAGRDVAEDTGLDLGTPQIPAPEFGSFEAT